MKDHEGRLETQPVLGCVVPGMERQGDGHIAEEGVARVSEFDRVRIGERPAGVLAHVGQFHGVHWVLSLERDAPDARTPARFCMQGWLG